MCYPAVCRAHVVWFERPRQVLIYEAHHTTAINRHRGVCCVCDGQQIGLRPGLAAIHGLDEMDRVGGLAYAVGQSKTDRATLPAPGVNPKRKTATTARYPKDG